MNDLPFLVPWIQQKLDGISAAVWDYQPPASDMDVVGSNNSTAIQVSTVRANQLCVEEQESRRAGK